MKEILQYFFLMFYKKYEKNKKIYKYQKCYFINYFIVLLKVEIFFYQRLMICYKIVHYYLLQK